MKPILYILILFISISGCSEESIINPLDSIASNDSTSEPTEIIKITDIDETDDSEEIDAGDTDDTTTTTTSTTTTTTIQSIITQDTIKFAIQTSNNAYFYDGTKLTQWKSGNIKKSGANEFVAGSKIYNLDSKGAETSSSTLLKIPASIKRTDSGAVWCYQYTNQESLAMGGLPKPYSEFYLDNIIISNWHNNQFECKSIKSIGNNVFAVDQNGGYYTISGLYTNVFHVDGLIMHSLDMPNKTIGFNGNTESYGFNYAMNSRQWILYDDIYYAENGYTWTESGGLIENATILHGFNTYPYFKIHDCLFSISIPCSFKILGICEAAYFIALSRNLIFASSQD